ncbi:hypothetical protein ACJX0J_026161 [Zea mays]
MDDQYDSYNMLMHHHMQHHGEITHETPMTQGVYLYRNRRTIKRDPKRREIFDFGTTSSSFLQILWKTIRNLLLVFVEKLEKVEDEEEQESDSEDEDDLQQFFKLKYENISIEQIKVVKHSSYIAQLENKNAIFARKT